MSEMHPRRVGASLLERAAEVYDFGAYARERSEVSEPQPAPRPIRADVPAPEPARQAEAKAQAQPAPARPSARDAVIIDREMLAEKNLLVPGAPIGALAEEFRLVKRQLLLTARLVRGSDADRARTTLVCSARPNEGKTYCAVNLALSMAAERETEILLIDADFAKPDVMDLLGLTEGRGLLDALADPALDVESLVVPTDVPHLSVLPAGTKMTSDTELVASERTPAVIARLLAADPRRILIFDSPPALAASPASVLAMHVGQVMMVVRADRTSEGDLREAVGLLDRCDHIQLVLNAVSFAQGSHRFGSYYGQEDAK